MSLDKWIKPEKKKKAPKKEPVVKKEPKKESVVKKDLTEKKVSKKKVEIDSGKNKSSDKKLPPKQKPPKITKHLLKCSKKSCKYQRTLVKKNLSEKDMVCRKCKSKMTSKKV